MSMRKLILLLPALLLLDPSGKKKLGTVGDESPEEVAATLRTALGR